MKNLGFALVQGGRPEDAVPLHERALEIWEARAPGSPSVGISLTDHGRALVRAGQPDQAVVLLERAIEIFGTQTIDPAELARARFVLAQAVAASGGDVERARGLAQQARATYTA